MKDLNNESSAFSRLLASKAVRRAFLALLVAIVSALGVELQTGAISDALDDAAPSTTAGAADQPE